MTRSSSLISVALGLLLLVFPAAATLVLSDISFSPDGPLAPGAQQHAVVTCAIIPSGSETFARGHSLQIQTDLSGAIWTIQVRLDGSDAARQAASGPVAFVNGEILAYPTNRDVGVIVTVDGTVPANATGSLTVLQAKELDNAGNIVPGSILAVGQPVAGATIPPSPSQMPALTSQMATTPLPTMSPGFAAPCALIAIVAAVTGLKAFFREQ
jgi:hypothetical protein